MRDSDRARCQALRGSLREFLSDESEIELFLALWLVADDVSEYANDLRCELKHYCDADGVDQADLNEQRTEAIVASAVARRIKTSHVMRLFAIHRMYDYTLRSALQTTNGGNELLADELQTQSDAFLHVHHEAVSLLSEYSIAQLRSLAQGETIEDIPRTNGPRGQLVYLENGVFSEEAMFADFVLACEIADRYGKALIDGIEEIDETIYPEAPELQRAWGELVVERACYASTVYIPTILSKLLFYKLWISEISARLNSDSTGDEMDLEWCGAPWQENVAKHLPGFDARAAQLVEILREMGELIQRPESENPDDDGLAEGGIWT